MSKPTTTLSSFQERGGAWVIGQSLLLMAVVLLGVVFPGDWSRTSVMLAGVVLFGVGGVVGLAGVRVLGRNRTPFPKPRAHSQFVQHGIYARVRHPLYTSVMLASLGWALLWQSLASGVAALLLIPFLRAKARREESWLRATFPEYVEYARWVPPFLPRLRPCHPSPLR